MEIPETTIEFLQNLKREFTLTRTGFGAYIRVIDIFLDLIEQHPECLCEYQRSIDQHLDLRKSFTKYLEEYEIKIQLLNGEIEREKLYPNNQPMISRLIQLLGNM